MKKYKVFVPCDYIVGHLRYGHFEGEVEVNSIEEVKDILTKESIWCNLDLVIDDYSLDDYQVDFKGMEIEEYE